MRRAHKYGAVKTDVDGVRFDSKAEARRWVELRILEQGGVIQELERQRSFDIVVNEVKICRYKADFAYKMNGEQVVEDVKGYETPEFKLKWKLMHAVFPSLKLMKITGRRNKSSGRR